MSAEDLVKSVIGRRQRQRFTSYIQAVPRLSRSRSTRNGHRLAPTATHRDVRGVAHAGGGPADRAVHIGIAAIEDGAPQYASACWNWANEALSR
ncbi:MULTISPECIES: hypothetical protein [Xanthomonas]|uniref:hypothetical protein n=1 Tax=Xanthomonas TaxID=338 RepID=UPI001FD45AA7|nr:hypothetical protein [Xanthomonas phaseoli]